MRPARATMLASLGVERVRGCVDVWAPSAAGTREQ